MEPGEEGWPGTGADAAASTTAGSLLRGGAWSTTSRLVPQLYVLAISIAGARFLGAEQFGRQSFIAFVELSLILFLSGGLSITATRFVGDVLGRQQPAAVASLVRWIWRVEAIAAVAGGSVLVIAAAAGADPQSAWVLAGVACTLGILHAAPSALLIGSQRWRAASVVGLVTGAASTVAIIIVLAAGGRDHGHVRRRGSRRSRQCSLDGGAGAPRAVRGGPGCTRAAHRCSLARASSRAVALRDPDELRRPAHHRRLAALGVLLPRVLLDRYPDRALLGRVRGRRGADPAARRNRSDHAAGGRNSFRSRPGRADSNRVQPCPPAGPAGVPCR